MPTEIPTEIIPLPAEPELTIIEETAEKAEEIFILVTEFLRKAAPFVILILGSYLGAFLASLVVKDDDSIKDDDSANVGSILLYGTVGWVVVLLIGIFGIFNVFELTVILSFTLFAIFGMISYVAFTLLENRTN